MASYVHHNSLVDGYASDGNIKIYFSSCVFLNVCLGISCWLQKARIIRLGKGKKAKVDGICMWYCGLQDLSNIRHIELQVFFMFI